MIEEAILNRLVRRLERALAPPSLTLCRFVVEGALVGEIEPVRVERLRGFSDVFVVGDRDMSFVPGLRDCDARSAAMERVARTLAAEGALSPWRDERYEVAPAFGAPPCFLLERAAARYFGIATYAVHVNGTTQRDDGREAMWIARRSPHKAIDPGLLDNLVGGGIAAGGTVQSTLVREAWEEAGLAPDVASRAVLCGTVSIRRLHPDGLQRETIFVHDLDLPADVAPVNQDGEVVAFRLACPDELAWLAGNETGPDVATADATVVMADWAVRRGYVEEGSESGRRLRMLCRRRWPAA